LTTTTRPIAAAGIIAAISLGALTLAAESSGIVAPPEDGFAAFDPGALTRWGLPLMRFAATSSALFCTGTLLVLVVLEQRRASLPALEDTSGRLCRSACWLAAATCVLQTLQVVLAVSAAVGRPVLDVPSEEFVACLRLSSNVYCQVGIAGSIILAVLVSTRIPSHHLLLLALVVTAVPFMGGHASSAPNHVLSVAFVIVHVLAAALWIGGLAALLLTGLVLRDFPALRAAIPPFSRVALGCAAVSVLSGIGNTLARAPEQGRYADAYLALLGVKVVLFVVLCGFGVQHQRRAFRRAASSDRTHDSDFLRRSVAEAAIMVAIVAVATVLSETPPEALS
jgi:putative copper resistance protein D